MSTNDFVKFMTVTLVSHFEVPKEERKQRKLERKQERNPFLYQCFGLIPMAIGMLFRKKPE